MDWPNGTLMADRRPDPPGARRPPGHRAAVPSRAVLGGLVLAATCVAIVALSGDGQAYWLCVPGALLVATGCRSRVAAALAGATVCTATGAATLAAASGGPPLWLAIVVPTTSLVVLARLRAGLERERDDLRDFALTDPLTRVANRRALLHRLEHELDRHRRNGRPFAIVMLDLDGFKPLNDRFGHEAGDDLLRDVAAALSRAMRAQDLVARIGGDEFCVLAPETDGPGAERLAGRVRGAVRTVTAGAIAVRGSVGAAVFPDDAEDPIALMRVADARLLAAKRELYGDGERRPATRRRAA